MEPAEIMTSESQERMLAIVEPGDLDEVLAVCRRWEVQATVVGTVTTGGRLRILDGPDGEVLADVPAATLHDDAPRYHRPLQPPADLDARRADDPSRLPAPADCGADLLEHAGRHVVGLDASTTTSCSSTPSRAPAATPPSCG